MFDSATASVSDLSSAIGSGFGSDWTTGSHSVSATDSATVFD